MRDAEQLIDELDRSMTGELDAPYEPSREELENIELERVLALPEEDQAAYLQRRRQLRAMWDIAMLLRWGEWYYSTDGWSPIDTLAFGYERTEEMWKAAHPQQGSGTFDGRYDGLDDSEVEFLESWKLNTPDGLFTTREKITLPRPRQPEGLDLPEEDL